MASVYNFIRRHRRKLVWGGAAVGGCLIAARLLERHLTQSRDREGKLALESTRKRNHYESTECTCNSTTSHLFHQLKQRIVHTFDATHLTDALRAGPQSAEKIRLWNEIKVLCFCKSTAYVVCEAFLGVLLRVQLSVLAGHLFTERIPVTSLLNNNRPAQDSSRFPSKLREHYLNLSNYFIDEGFNAFCKELQTIVTARVDAIKLQEKLGIYNIESIFTDILKDIQQDTAGDGLFINPGKFLLSSQQSSTAKLRDWSECDLETYASMLSDTLEILESKEVSQLLNKLCQQGIALLTDQLCECYQSVSSEQSIKQDTANDGDLGFVSPCSVTIPLAKLIPAITHLVQVSQEEEGKEEKEKEKNEEIQARRPNEEEPWLAHILDNSDLKLLAANIYETFCSAHSTTAQQQPPQQQQQSWLEYAKSSVNSLF